MTLVKIHHLDKNSSLWWKSIILMKIYHTDETSSFIWNCIGVMKIHNNDEIYQITVLKIYHCNEIVSMRWKLISLIKFITMDKVISFNENLSNDEISYLYWKIIAVSTIYWYEKNFITMIKFITVMKCHHSEVMKVCQGEDHS